MATKKKQPKTSVKKHRHVTKFEPKVELEPITDAEFSAALRKVSRRTPESELESGQRADK